MPLSRHPDLGFMTPLPFLGMIIGILMFRPLKGRGLCIMGLHLGLGFAGGPCGYKEYILGVQSTCMGTFLVPESIP